MKGDTDARRGHLITPAMRQEALTLWWSDHVGDWTYDDRRRVDELLHAIARPSAGDVKLVRGVGAVVVDATESGERYEAAVSLTSDNGGRL